jgi:hypothetical protein|uniref:hypothetical protein n=1 Tax=Ruminococcus bicirculans (ex Wegman et al. 2014) TaxID=1160721 RepID=UPI00402965ED
MYNIIKLDDEKDMDYIDCKFGLMYSEASVYMELNSEDDLPKFMKEIHKFANLRSGADVYVASGKLLNKSYELFGELAKYKLDDNHIFAFVNPSYLCNRVKDYEAKLASSEFKQFRELNDYLNGLDIKEDEYVYGNDLDLDVKHAFDELLKVVNKYNNDELSNSVAKVMDVLSCVYAKNCDIQNDLEELAKKYN